MVGELTVGREKYAAVQDEMTRVKDEAKKVAAELLELIDRDTDAFNAFMAAMKLPKNTDEEKAARKAAMQQAAKGTVEAPLCTLNLCAKAASLALEAIRMGNTNAVTDAASAGQFARAAAMSAAYNVRINLLSIKDEQYVSEKRLAVAELLSSVETDMDQISEVIEKALA